MSNLVSEYINAQNRPFNAQNIADALGRHGIKKGMDEASGFVDYKDDDQKPRRR